MFLITEIFSVFVARSHTFPADFVTLLLVVCLDIDASFCKKMQQFVSGFLDRHTSSTVGCKVWPDPFLDWVA